MTAFRGYMLLALVVLLLGTHSYMYKKGKSVEQQKAMAAAFEFRERENVLLAAIEKEKSTREVVYRDRTKIVREASSDCLDNCRLPKPVFDILQQSSGSTP